MNGLVMLLGFIFGYMLSGMFITKNIPVNYATVLLFTGCTVALIANILYSYWEYRRIKAKIAAARERGVTDANL